MKRKTKPRSSSKKSELTYASPRVAAIQMRSTPNPEENLALAHSLFQEALKHDPNWVAFPENFLFLAPDRQAKDYAQTLKGEWIEILAEWACEADVWLHAGTIPMKGKGGKTTNTTLLFSPDGDIVSRYDKIHLFDVNVAGDQSYKESTHIEAGKKPALVTTPWGRAGLSVCYDLRFPELYRHYSKKGAEMLFIPAAFTQKTGQAHWDVLTRARAIENLSYVIAPAQWGSPYEGRTCFGHTRIIDPWGRVVAERKEGDGVVWADLNFPTLAEYRENLPCLSHRKLG